jgi:hypothetical protein
MPATRHTLISRQSAAVEACLETRTSERRTLRMRVRVLCHYRTHAAKLGYTPEQIEQQVRDIRDMVELERIADDELDTLAHDDAVDAAEHFGSPRPL